MTEEASPNVIANPRAMLLAVSPRDVPDTLARDLRVHGLEVHTIAYGRWGRRRGVREVAAAALELRHRRPDLPLLTCGPSKLLRMFSTRYPALSDGELDPGSAGYLLEQAASMLAACSRR
ncbi:MAG: hypothetical protein ACYDAG_04110, partial [Chloroflexota bacterium]